jgi:hypothetical protein
MLTLSMKILGKLEKLIVDKHYTFIVIYWYTISITLLKLHIWDFD